MLTIIGLMVMLTVGGVNTSTETYMYSGYNHEGRVLVVHEPSLVGRYCGKTTEINFYDFETYFGDDI